MRILCCMSMAQDSLRRRIRAAAHASASSSRFTPPSWSLARAWWNPEVPANRLFYFDQSPVFVQIDQERMCLSEAPKVPRWCLPLVFRPLPSSHRDGRPEKQQPIDSVREATCSVPRQLCVEIGCQTTGRAKQSLAHMSICRRLRRPCISLYIPGYLEFLSICVSV